MHRGPSKRNNLYQRPHETKLSLFSAKEKKASQILDNGKGGEGCKKDGIYATIFGFHHSLT